jgi:mannose-6-phosphate isomerase-like protein (cupin superfamily)
MYLVRPDEAQVASVEVTTDKARTAAIYRRPSKDFEDQAAGGRPSALHLARAVPLQGGIPIEHDGAVIGAIGVSGATSADEDNELAGIGAAAVQRAMAPRNGRHDGAVFLPAAAVVKQFESGGLLVDEPAYQVDAGRREAPGEAEYHEHVTDVMRVVQGTATVITGGELRDARAVAPGELRATSVEGGERHTLREGDVLAIPSGVPHQFVEVSDPFLYFVVKVTAR